MVNQCANRSCGKPLHYLREGRIFVFDLPEATVPVPAGGRARRLHHFWLCGACSETMVMEQVSDQEIQVALKTGPPGQPFATGHSGVNSTTLRS